MQVEGNQQQQGSTSDSTLVQPSEDDSKKDTTRSLLDASFPTFTNSKMARSEQETTTGV